MGRGSTDSEGLPVKGLCKREVKNYIHSYMVDAQCLMNSSANRATSKKSRTHSQFVCFGCLLGKYII